MLIKVGLLNLARPIGIRRQVMCESLKKHEQRTSKKVQQQLGRGGMLFLMFIYFVFYQKLNENYTSKSENQAVISSGFNFQRGKKRLGSQCQARCMVLKILGALLMIMR